MKKILFVVALAFFSISSYSQSTNTVEQVQYDNSQYIQVYITAKGKLLVNDQKTNIKDFEKTLRQLEERNGIVKFARESASKKAQEKSKEVSKLISKYKRKVEHYNDRAFTNKSRF